VAKAAVEVTIVVAEIVATEIIIKGLASKVPGIKVRSRHKVAIRTKARVIKVLNRHKDAIRIKAREEILTNPKVRDNKVKEEVPDLNRVRIGKASKAEAALPAEAEADRAGHSQRARSSSNTIISSSNTSSPEKNITSISTAWMSASSTGLRRTSLTA
jgi:hypothetical protein